VADLTHCRAVVSEWQSVPCSLPGVYLYIVHCFSYTLNIEAVSCDELFVDCVDLLTDTAASPSQFALLLRGEIRDRTGCTASVGIG